MLDFSGIKVQLWEFRCRISNLGATHYLGAKPEKNKHLNIKIVYYIYAKVYKNIKGL